MSWYGTNPTTPLDYTGAKEFIDAFKTARKFEPLSGVLNFVNGWPQNDCRQTIFTDGALSENGEYQVLYKGQMNVGLPGGSPASLLPVKPAGTLYPDYNVAPVVVRAVGSQSAQLHLSYKNIVDLKEIIILRPGYKLEDAKNQIFTTEFLKYVESLGSGPLRFMPWGKINSCPVVEYSHFTEISDVFWRGDDLPDDEPDNGAPFELFLELCRRLKRDPHVNIPHLASDTCVEGMALKTKDSLADGCYVILEYTSEHWNTNGNFTQSKYFEQQADARFASDINVRRSQAYARRLCAVARIWRRVFGRQADRVRVIAAGQLHNPSVLRFVMEWMDQNEPEKTDLIWGLSGTGYFGGPTATTIEVMQSAGNALWKSPDAQAFLKTCLKYKKTSNVYEGGASSGDAQLPALAALHLDPAMEQIVVDSLLDFRTQSNALGVTPGYFMYFLLVQVFKTLYGLSPNVSQPDAPKARGFRTVATTTPQRPPYVDDPTGPLKDQIAVLTEAVNVLQSEKLDLSKKFMAVLDSQRKVNDGLTVIRDQVNQLLGGQ